MERVLDRDAELLEFADRLLAQIAGGVAGRQVEVPAGVEGPRRLPRHRWLEVEELDVGGDVEGETLGMGGLYVSSEHLTGIAVERRAVEMVDVTEHPGLGGSRIAPGEDLEGVRVGHGEHVGLLHPGEAVDGRAVEGHPVGERVVELGRGDGEALEVSEHVGEPEPHQADPALLDRLQDVVALLLTHVIPFHDTKCVGNRPSPHPVAENVERGPA